MFYKGYITYKSKASNSFSFNLIMTTPPEIVHSEIKHDVFDIPGRDGELYGQNTYRGNATVKVSFDIVTTGSVSNYTAALDELYLWLSGTGNLVISDEAVTYEVLKVNITTDQRTIVNYGKIDVEFIVYPFKFKNSSSYDDRTITNTSITVALTSSKCRPLYKLNGSSSITVNGSTFSNTSTSAVFVDTRRKISYFENSSSAESYVSGDYEKIVLNNGNNTVTATGTAKIVKTNEGFEI